MENTHPTLVDEKVLHKGDWLILNEKTLKVKGQEVKYEYVSRPKHLTNPNGSMIIPIVRKQNKKYVILIANYRPAIMGFSLEFPGGFADEGETLEQCVSR